MTFPQLARVIALEQLYRACTINKPSLSPLMKQLILATHNDHKAQEFRDILQRYSLQTLKELGYGEEAVKLEKLEENSFHKAKTVFKVYGHVVISDDSGLEVNAPMEHGVYSARYAGEPRTIIKIHKNYSTNYKVYQTGRHNSER